MQGTITPPQAAKSQHDASTGTIPMLDAPGKDQNKAKIRVLDITSAHRRVLTISPGETQRFETLDITLERCWLGPPGDIRQAAALVEIWDTPAGEERRRVYYGWIIQSQPEVSAIAHPHYDVVLEGCVEKHS